MNDDYTYFAKLTPRQQLNDLLHKYAQANGGKYGDAWREFSRRWKAKHGTDIRKNIPSRQTLPAYLEKTKQIETALQIAYQMTQLQYSIRRQVDKGEQNDFADESAR